MIVIEVCHLYYEVCQAVLNDECTAYVGKGRGHNDWPLLSLSASVGNVVLHGNEVESIFLRFWWWDMVDDAMTLVKVVACLRLLVGESGQGRTQPAWLQCTGIE